MGDKMDNGEDSRAVAAGASRLRRPSIVAAGIGLGAALVYLISKAFGGRRERSPRRNFPDQIVDDRGTGQEKAAQLLLNLRDRAFEASNEKLALALGRPTEEVEAWNAGQEVIDDDVVMKARGLAMHRGVHIE
jgi:hypothetical protein